jgi:hypothetical protein
VSKLSRLTRKGTPDVLAGPTGPVLTVRFVLALILFLGGIAWIAYYYVGVRPSEGFPEFPGNSATGPHFMQKLEGWNYLIGFGAIMLGLVVSAHPSTPMGRGRGVVVGMLACFLVGLVWICTYYVTQTGDSPMNVPVINDLQQKNLFVGIALMAVGFTFATRWE